MNIDYFANKYEFPHLCYWEFLPHNSLVYFESFNYNSCSRYRYQYGKPIYFSHVADEYVYFSDEPNGSTYWLFIYKDKYNVENLEEFGMYPSKIEKSSEKVECYVHVPSKYINRLKHDIKHEKIYAYHDYMNQGWSIVETDEDLDNYIYVDDDMCVYIQGELLWIPKEDLLKYENEDENENIQVK